MSQYDNSNRIAIWPNDRREQQSHPHLKGQGETDAPVWASAWFSDDISDDDKRALAGILKRYDSKRPFLRISLQPKDESHRQGMAEAREAVEPSTPDLDGDISW